LQTAFRKLLARGRLFGVIVIYGAAIEADNFGSAEAAGETHEEHPGELASYGSYRNFDGHISRAVRRPCGTQARDERFPLMYFP
jgi:hypothetical protein